MSAPKEPELKIEPLISPIINEALIDQKQESNYFYGNEDAELDVADYIAKSAPTRIKNNPHVNSYKDFLNIYGFVLAIYGVVRFTEMVYDFDDFIKGGQYYYTLHHLFIVVNMAAYMLIGGYCIFKSYTFVLESFTFGQEIIVNSMFMLFICDSLDIAYLAHSARVSDQYWEWLFCLVVYLFAYINHYDFNKLFKLSIFPYF